MLETDIHIKPSKRFIALFIIKIALVFVAILSTPMQPSMKFTLLLIGIFYGGFILWRRGFLLSSNSILAVRSLPDKTWLLFTKNNVITGELLVNSTINRMYMVLNFKIPKGWWKVRSITLFNDSLESDLYQKLLSQVRVMK